MIKVYPTKFEAYELDDTMDVFEVKAHDECCAEVTIKTVVTLESWLEMVPLITQCIKDLKLET